MDGATSGLATSGEVEGAKNAAAWLVPGGGGSRFLFGYFPAASCRFADGQECRHATAAARSGGGSERAASGFVQSERPGAYRVLRLHDRSQRCRTREHAHSEMLFKPLMHSGDEVCSTK